MQGDADALNLLFTHASGAHLYVGNGNAAKSRELLDAHHIRTVVNCSDTIPNYYADVGIAYFSFDLYAWITAQHTARQDMTATVGAFSAPLLAFVNEALAAGQSVLVHCWAGAHRAGTTGVLLLMHLLQIDVKGINMGHKFIS
jgi:protein tyrosine/serine phosphatase